MSPRFEAVRQRLAWAESPRAIHFVVALGVALRLVELALVGTLPLVSDDLLYHEFAQKLIRGEVIYPLVPPALGYYLSFFYRLFGESPLVARACILPFYPLFAYLLYRIAGRLAGRQAATLLVLVFSLYPIYMHLSVEPVTHLPAAVLLLAVVELLLRAREQLTWGTSVALGVVLGLLTLTRSSNLILVGVLPLYLLWRTRRLVRAAVPAALALVLIALWIGKIHQMTGRFVVINYSSSQNVFLGNNAYTPLYRTWWFAAHLQDAEGIPQGFHDLNNEILRHRWYQQDALYREQAVEHILSRPDLFVLRTLNRMRCYFAFETYTGSWLINLYGVPRLAGLAAVALDALFYAVVMGSAILFLFTFRWKSNPGLEGVLLLLGLALFYGFPYWLSVAHPIYHFPIIPLLGICAAMGWGRLLREGPTEMLAPLRASVRRRRGFLAALVLFAYIQVEFAVVMFLYSRY